MKRRPPGRQIDHAHIPPPDPGTQSSPKRLGAGLLGCKALGVGLRAVSALVGFGSFGLREHAIEETVAVTFDDLGDTARIADIRADADDHDAALSKRKRPRSIAARILRTLASKLSKIASLIKKCPILSSTICGNVAISSALRKSRP